jgi:hypothetical protein
LLYILGGGAIANLQVARVLHATQKSCSVFMLDGMDFLILFFVLAPKNTGATTKTETRKSVRQAQKHNLSVGGPIQIACLGIKLNEGSLLLVATVAEERPLNQPFILQLSKHVSLCHHGCKDF